MNAATVTVIIVLVFALAWTTALAYRRRTPQPPPAEPERVGPPPTIYDKLAADLGDPHHIDLDPPPFAWPA